MIQRTRIIPTAPMARVLAEHHPDDRATPGAAALVLLQAGYLPDDIAVGLKGAMRLAGDLAAAAASDRPWALALGIVRDLAACAAIISAVALWAVPA